MASFCWASIFAASASYKQYKCLIPINGNKNAKLWGDGDQLFGDKDVFLELGFEEIAFLFPNHFDAF